MPAPTRRAAPPPPPEKKKMPVVQLAAAGVILLIGAGAVIWMLSSGSKEEEGPKSALPPASLPTSKPKEPVASKPDSYLLELPADVRKEINQRLDPHSSKVDGLERKQKEVEKIEDPQKRMEEYDSLRDSYAEVADAIEEIRVDPKYKKYREDARYSVSWNGFFNRLGFYNSKLTSLKKLSDNARNEMLVSKKKAEKPASSPK